MKTDNEKERKAERIDGVQNSDCLRTWSKAGEKIYENCERLGYALIQFLVIVLWTFPVLTILVYVIIVNLVIRLIIDAWTSIFNTSKDTNASQ